MTPTQTILNECPSTPTIEDALAIREMSTAWKSKYVRMTINRKQLSFNYDVGVAVGHLLRTMHLPAELLDIGRDLVVRDWAIRPRGRPLEPSRSEFIEGVSVGYSAPASEHIPVSTSSVRPEDNSSFSEFIQEVQIASQASVSSISDAVNALDSVESPDNAEYQTTRAQQDRQSVTAPFDASQTIEVTISPARERANRTSRDEAHLEQYERRRL